MIWRCRDLATKQFRSVVGKEWIYGCCPLCKEERNHMMPLKCVGTVKNQRTLNVLLVMHCSLCESVFIWNYETYQIVEACKIHWHPKLMRNCKVCINGLQKDIHEAREQEAEVIAKELTQEQEATIFGSGLL